MREKLKNFMQKISALAQRIPEFSDKNYKLASYICGALLALCSIFFIYEMFTVDHFGFRVNWNIFTSIWLTPLFFIGFILAIVYWGRLGHWSAKPVYVDKDGKVYENNDMADNTFYQILMPILGHFVIEPLLYACLIYYPIVCVFAILNSLIPYILTVILVAISVFAIISSKYVMNIRYRSAILVAVTVLGSVVLLWSSISMESGKVDILNQTEAVMAPVAEEAVEVIESVENEASDLDIQK